MSQVTKTLLDLTQRRNFYAGDLLSSVEILRNVTDTFKRASYEPSSDDVQVSGSVSFVLINVDHAAEVELCVGFILICVLFCVLFFLLHT